MGGRVTPGPLPGDDPLWGWRDFRGHPCVVLRCALCGRPCGPRTSDLFFNLYAPLGRQLIVAWHRACSSRDPLKEETYWHARQDRARWDRFLDAVAARGGGRVGPGRGYRRAA